MKFRESPPPTPTKIAQPIDKRPNPFLRLPNLGLLTGEFKYWRDAHDTAEREGDELVSAIAKAVKDRLRETSRIGMRLVQQTEKGTPRNSVEVATWYTTGISYLAFSRMWREMSSGICIVPSGVDEVEATDLEPKHSMVLSDMEDPRGMPVIVADFGFRAPRSCALHMQPQTYTDLYGSEAPRDENRWLEGESVFIEVASPARPSSLVEQVTQQSRGVAFPIGEYVTVEAHLKSDVWQTYLD